MESQTFDSEHFQRVLNRLEDVIHNIIMKLDSKSTYLSFRTNDARHQQLESIASLFIFSVLL